MFSDGRGRKIAVPMPMFGVPLFHADVADDDDDGANGRQNVDDGGGKEWEGGWCWWTWI